MHSIFFSIWVLAASLTLFASGCERKSAAEKNAPAPVAAEPVDTKGAERLSPEYDGNDESRRKIGVALEPIAGGFGTITDIQFVPGRPELMIVLEKDGTARWVDLDAGEQGKLLGIKVKTDIEEGLLGLAFHPDYEKNGKFYLNYVVGIMEKDFSRVGEWLMNGDPKSGKAKESKVIMVVEQPFANHNAGQLQFGPDGYLYIGWGDGGSGGDPLKNGQNPNTMLGSMLRIDVDKADTESDSGPRNRPNGKDEKPYGIPPDNPFIDKEGYLPEVWAYGFRNPWRYSFSPDGRLIVADVGQSSWEEIDIVAPGRNYGWNIREGFHCFSPPEGCRSEGLTNPIYEYQWGKEGRSITGGYVYTGEGIPELRNKYIFGDYVSGRLWALDLPPIDVIEYPEPTLEPFALGRFPINPTTFGRGGNGEMYVGDSAKGVIYRIIAARQ